VSTAEQAREGFSLGEQERRVRAHAEAQGWKLETVYVDPGISGGIAFADRPAGAKALTAASDLDRLIVVKLDRLGRSAADLLNTIGRFAEMGCDFVSVSESIDTSTAPGRLLGTMLAGVAEFEKDRISERVLEAEHAKALAGRPHGGPRIYGYRYDQGLVIVEAEAVIVRRIFAEFVAGRSLTAIARDLHRDGVPTLRGRYWRQSTVRGILENQKYLGRVTHRGEVFPGNHEPIVDGETFQRARALLAGRSNRRGRPPKGPHLFRNGMLRCECGEAMVPRTNGGHEYYYCNGHQKLGADFCSMTSIRRADVDGAVYRYFEQVGLDVEATRLQLTDARERKLTEVGALGHQAEQEVRRAEERLARVRRDYTDGNLDAADWVSFRDELTAEMEAARAEAARLRQSEIEVERDTALLDAEHDILDRLAQIRRAISGEITDAAGVDAVRAALSRLFSAFVLHPQQNPRYQGQGRSELIDVDDILMIELAVHDHALVGYNGGLLPVLRREPLHQAENKEHVGLPIRYASGPS
jgi:DNA invertase Pin-like site-specific DNA recombinase